MKLSLILVTLLVVGRLASAATEWTTIPQTFDAKTGNVCKLSIHNLVVVPSAGQEYDTTTTKMNKLLSQSAQDSVQTYLESVGSLPDRCDKSRAGGITVESATSLAFKAATWSSWEQAESGFTGGAHGYANVKRLVLSEQGDQVTFDQVLGVSREAFIQKVKAKLILIDRYSQGSFEMWADSKTTDPIKTLNYFANDKGIAIFFNDYQIASYAKGPSEISFTWAELKSLLKAGGVFAEYLK